MRFSLCEQELVAGSGGFFEYQWAICVYGDVILRFLFGICVGS